MGLQASPVGRMGAVAGSKCYGFLFSDRYYCDGRRRFRPPKAGSRLRLHRSSPGIPRLCAGAPPRTSASRPMPHSRIDISAKSLVFSQSCQECIPLLLLRSSRQSTRPLVQGPRANLARSRHRPVQPRFGSRPWLQADSRAPCPTGRKEKRNPLPPPIPGKSRPSH